MIVNKAICLQKWYHISVFSQTLQMRVKRIGMRYPSLTVPEYVKMEEMSKSDDIEILNLLKIILDEKEKLWQKDQTLR